MQHPQHIVEHLLQLRSHYQSLQNEYERSCLYIKEQLSHVNALLVDQLVENQQFAESLIQMRSHYQALHHEQQQKAARAREQLAHVNALLADQAVLQHSEHQPVSIQAATLEQQALTGTVDGDSKESPQQEPEVVEEPETLEISQQQLQKDFNQGEQDEEKLVQEPEPPEKPEQPIPSAPIQVKQHSEPQPPTQLPGVEDSHQERSHLGKPATSSALRHSAPLKTPLLPQYQHLNKSEAVEQLLHEHSGSILHVDYIIRALYGELTPEDVKAEKPRMNDTLNKGVAKGLWDRVPDAPGCYTVDIKLVEKEAKAKKVEAKKHHTRKPNSKATEGMLPRYQNLTFTEAVETVVRDRSGEVLTSDIVARALYGELEGKALTQAKTHVGKTLWSGANQKRWQRVPGQLGAYTLDLEAK